MDESDRIGCGDMDELRDVFENVGCRMVDAALDMVPNVCPFCGGVHNSPQQQQAQGRPPGPQAAGVCPLHGAFGGGHQQPASGGCTSWGSFAPTFFGAFGQQRQPPSYQPPTGYTGYARVGQPSPPSSSSSGFGSFGNFGSFDFGNSFDFGSSGSSGGGSRYPGLHSGGGPSGYSSNYGSAAVRRPNLGPGFNGTSSSSSGSANRPAIGPVSGSNRPTTSPTYGTGYSSASTRPRTSPSYGSGYSSNYNSSTYGGGGASAGGSCGPRG